jgi:hypothetical protein
MAASSVRQDETEAPAVNYPAKEKTAGAPPGSHLSLMSEIKLPRLFGDQVRTARAAILNELTANQGHMANCCIEAMVANNTCGPAGAQPGCNAALEGERELRLHFRAQPPASGEDRQQSLAPTIEVATMNVQYAHRD